MRRNLAASLIQHETISTTLEKAKDVKSFIEKLITLAKKGTLSARRRAIAILGNRDIIEYEESEPVKKGTVVGKLFSELGPRYLDRPGGYTRIVRLSLRRLGDDGELALLQLVGKEEVSKKEAKAGKKKRAHKKEKQSAEAKEVGQSEGSKAEDVAKTKETPESPQGPEAGKK
jgi:large subunit ribosomal protein L17